MGVPSELFREKIAVVTGGGSGLGRALCRELSDRGAISIVADINVEAAAQVAESIVAAGGQSLAIEMDVSQPMSVAEGIGKVVRNYGRLDYIFNNAGIVILGEVRDMHLEHWHSIINVNFLGVLYGTTVAYSQMLKQGSGHIVNISSLGGLTTLPTCTAYSTTKHAVVALSNSLRAEASGLGVKVSVVCPGLIKTGLGDSATILNLERGTVSNALFDKYVMDPTVAARLTLRQVERNQGTIVFPFYSRLLWWVYRVRPALFARIEARILSRFRAARLEKAV